MGSGGSLTGTTRPESTRSSSTTTTREVRTGRDSSTTGTRLTMLQQLISPNVMMTLTAGRTPRGSTPSPLTLRPATGRSLELPRTGSGAVMACRTPLSPQRRALVLRTSPTRASGTPTTPGGSRLWSRTGVTSEMLRPPTGTRAARGRDTTAGPLVDRTTVPAMVLVLVLVMVTDTATEMVTETVTAMVVTVPD